MWLSIPIAPAPSSRAAEIWLVAAREEGWSIVATECKDDLSKGHPSTRSLQDARNVLAAMALAESVTTLTVMAVTDQTRSSAPI